MGGTLTASLTLSGAKRLRLLTLNQFWLHSAPQAEDGLPKQPFPSSGLRRRCTVFHSSKIPSLPTLGGTSAERGPFAFEQSAASHAAARRGLTPAPRETSCAVSVGSRADAAGRRSSEARCVSPDASTRLALSALSFSARRDPLALPLSFAHRSRWKRHEEFRAEVAFVRRKAISIAPVAALQRSSGVPPCHVEPTVG
jgi:hypothetical protein